MTDTTGSTPPFPGFPGFPPAEMLERMWGMMRLSPFGSAFSGGQPGAGLAPSLSMMSDMMAPLTNVEELDKRITDMRAVEQWLKLNLSMLQSAIQALEVQRATLATLRAFGAFAQSSMSQPSAAATPSPTPATGWPHPAAPAPAPESSSGEEGDASNTPPFDASAWWNLLQSQFNQIAQFAMTQPSVATAAAGGGTAREMQAAAEAEAASSAAASDASGGEAAESAGASKTSEPDTGASTKRPAAKRPSTTSSAKRAGSAGAAAARTTKKSI